MCTVLLPPGDKPIAVNRYIISYMFKTFVSLLFGHSSYHHAKARFLIVDNAKRLEENPVVFASATHVIAPCYQQVQLSTRPSPLQTRMAYLNTFKLSLWSGLKQRINTICALLCKYWTLHTRLLFDPAINFLNSYPFCLCTKSRYKLSESIFVKMPAEAIL
jgi:hypothetical protein